MPLLLLISEDVNATAAATEVVRAAWSESSIVVVDDNAAGLSSNSCSAVRAAVEREISDQRLVIVNAQCTCVKALRYELYCRTRAARTAYAVMWIHAAGEKGSAAHVFEPPAAGRRWDNPLFHADAAEGVNYEELFATLRGGRRGEAVHVSTVPQLRAAAELVQRVDKAARTVEREIATTTKQTGCFEIKISGVREIVRLPREGVSVRELARLRRRFVEAAGGEQVHGVEERDWRASFVRFVNDSAPSLGGR